MAEIHIHRAHRLGLAKARKTAWRWAERAEEKFGMECTLHEGETSDVVEFVRPGVEGRLIVAADSFDLTAQLGLVLGVFRGRIEEAIEENLDAVLADAAAVKKKSAGKAAAKRK
ncbi:MAG TPA: polyhydroxyalkanoic acid system family protein [Caldimonas sp.]|jgi:putative polyhydroxyalkanoate system protein|nr:polyhydroxyalkanoic acid system family protein [Caldimonas sp.]HEX4235829.1 polyhydroxyalkanoic acid system family protein [Caldimonas sp.]